MKVIKTVYLFIKKYSTMLNRTKVATYHIGMIDCCRETYCAKGHNTYVCGYTRVHLSYVVKSTVLDILIHFGKTVSILK